MKYEFVVCYFFAICDTPVKIFVCLMTMLNSNEEMNVLILLELFLSMGFIVMWEAWILLIFSHFFVTNVIIISYLFELCFLIRSFTIFMKICIITIFYFLSTEFEWSNLTIISVLSAVFHHFSSILACFSYPMNILSSLILPQALSKFN